MKKIAVSDVTLSSVEKQQQTLSFREKLSVAEKLDLAHVDALELPVLNDSKEAEVIFRTIATTVKNATVKIPVGDNLEGVKSAYECIKGAVKPCLQVVMPVSTTLMEYFYHLKAPAMLEKIGELVKCAKESCEKVEFVALDAFRTETKFVCDCVKVACENGATAVCISDDSGVAFPEEFFKLVSAIKSVSDVDVFVQPSDQLSLATACAIESIKAGADGVKTSVCGKYLSMANFADVVRAKGIDFGFSSDVDVTNVKTIQNQISGIACECEDSLTTTIATGIIDSTATLKDISDVIKQLGYELSDSDVGKVYEEFKRLTLKKDAIDMKEFEAVVASTAMQVPSTYHLVNYVVNSGNIIPATANVTLEKNGEKFTGVSTGDGPIDAAFHAIEQILGHHYELDDFQVHAVTKGREAVGSSIIRLRADGKLYPGNGVSTDIVGACIRAYINALNKIVYEG